ncbi:MAG: adenylyl-sulfate kinase [Gammaproteobacteria bacterium]|nr:adenylyl-sulfate kinase [Gammaproteobacteria bacterium]MCP5137019.1 adenylyl-sulfate kinase [Gammaproteobacteria bacterium]
MPSATNIVWHAASVSRERHEALNGHKGLVVWFTGLSGAGKSTIAHALEERLHDQGRHTIVLDGDNVRHGLCSDLGFSESDRRENIRRLGEVSKLFVNAGIITLTAFISPFRQDRQSVRNLIGNDDFIEVYCRCALEVCEQRDVKGLYKRARAGEIPNYTGISSPYEEPEQPEVIVDSDSESLETEVTRILTVVEARIRPQT